ncbi:hypothetical protein GOV13_04155 [Candidatus Pacearchaeota archaeon]|nr:hypothetical protein [Candidatus Pacearchaeota archaeon]
MKRGKELASLILTIFSINLISAFYESYNRFSISDFLNEFANFIGPSTLILGMIFIISFFFLYKLSQKLLGEGSSSAGIVAFVASFVIIYVINRIGFNFEGAFDYLGYSDGTLSMIVPIVLAILAIYLIYKIGFSRIFMLSGLTLILITFLTDWIYEQGVALVLGIFILLIGLWLWRRGSTRRRLRTRKRFQRIRGWGGRAKERWRAGSQARASAGQVARNVRARRKQEAAQDKVQARQASVQTQQIKQEDTMKKLSLARKIGIRNLNKKLDIKSKEYAEGLEIAKNIHKKATRLGWSKAGISPRKGEDPSEHKKRARKASDTYKSWYRQYSKNVRLQKEIQNIKQKIEHLKKRIN